MKLLTEEIKRELSKYPLRSQAEAEKLHFICKFFNPCGPGTWLIAEGQEEPGGDWLFFGKAEIGDRGELGYFRLSELEALKWPDGAPLIERDIWYDGEEEI